MKRVIKNKKKMKNTMYIVFGVFALALFTITRGNLSYASDGLILDDALDAIAESTVVSNPSPEGEESDVEENQTSGDEDITEPELNPDERLAEGDEISQDLDDANLEGDNNNEEELTEDENQEDKENEEVSNEEENDENETINEEDKETAKTTEEVEEPKDEDNNTNQENHGVSNENTNNEQEIILTRQNEESKFNKMIVEENNEIMAEKSATLLPGCEFNQKIKSLAKGENVGSCRGSDTLIKKFKRAINEPSAGTETGNISVDDTVYAWFDGSDGTIYYYTTADKIFMNENSSYMFNLLYNMEDINLTGFDSKNVKLMTRMFAYLGKSNSETLDLNFDKWNTNNVEDMESLFEYAKIGSLSMEGWDFSNVSTGNYIFQNASITGLNASGWILPGQLYPNFIPTNIENINVTNWDLKNITNLSNLFDYKSKLNNIIGLNTRKNTSGVVDLGYMFNGCNSLVRVDMSNMNFSSVTNVNYMFGGPNQIILSGTNFSSLNSISNMFGKIPTTLDMSHINLSSVKNLSYLFQGTLQYIDLSYANLSGVTNMSSMFINNKKLSYANFSGTNARNLTNASYMFQGCSSLTGVDLSNLITGNIVNISYMFNGCSSLKDINLSNWDTSNVTDMSMMFYGCSSITGLNLSGWDVRKSLGTFGQQGGTFGGMSKLKKLDVTNWNTSGVAIMNNLFNGLGSLEEIKGLNTWNTSSVTGMTNMFQGCSSLTELDLSNWDTSRVSNMTAMFNGCSNLETLKLDGWDMRLAGNPGVFLGGTPKLKNLSLSGWTLPGNLYYVICTTRGSSNIENINVTNWNLKNTTNMQGIFQNCSKLQNIEGIENWDTSNITDMTNMFYGCSSLTELDLSNWNTSRVSNMTAMFNGCSNLREINLSGFNTSKLINTSSMFLNDSKLKVIYVSQDFNTGITNSSAMFGGVTSIVGGNGTTYVGAHIDGAYAVIDNKDHPGYFTDVLDKPYTIIYHTNEGILSGEKTTYTQRDSFTLPVPIRTGYTFLGWTGSNGLNPEITVNIVEFTVGDLEYTANWGIGKYKIIFDTDGGNGINPIEKDYNSVINITLPTPKKECNEFSGWDVELPEIMPAHDITLKAIWNYTCSRSSGGGGGAKKSESTTREIAIDTPTEQEHNSANEEQKSETSETSNTPTNGETTHQVISVTQEISEDGTEVEVVVEAVAIKNTNIVATVRTETPVNGTNSSSSSSTTHTKEQVDAYSFAKSNGLTTTSSIEEAKMNTELTRIQMAKMLSNFAIDVLGQEPDTEKGVVNFDDVTNKMDKQYDNAVTKAYQLGIMGQNVKNNEFRPNAEVTRAEFTTALSRLLYSTEEGKNKGTGKYYIPHIAKLYNEGIISKADPSIKEKRGYVMTMLMRTVK